MEFLEVRWVDSRSEDNWIEQEDVKPQLATITTLGCVVKETDKILCIAASVDDATGQVSGIMHIPKQCILSRRRNTTIWVIEIDQREGLDYRWYFTSQKDANYIADNIAEKTGKPRAAIVPVALCPYPVCNACFGAMYIDEKPCIKCYGSGVDNASD